MSFSSAPIPILDFTTVIKGVRTVTTRTVQQTIIEETVPTSKIWTIKRLNIFCRLSGKFTIEIVGGSIIGSGGTGPSEINAKYIFDPVVPLIAGKVVKVKYLAQGPMGHVNGDLDAYLMIEERDA